MKIPTLLYLSRAEAIKMGFTHEGKLYGIPAYLAESEDPDAVMACPKLPLLQFVAMSIDALFELFSWLIPGDYEVETPIRWGRELEARA